MKTVKELKELLASCADDDIVFMSSDEEGNTVSNWLDASTGILGTPYTFDGFDGKPIVLKDGEDYVGVDLTKDHGKRYGLLYPSV